MKLIETLMADRKSGLKTAPDGHRYFVQRLVEFQTLSLESAELLEGGWLDYHSPLTPPDWEASPSYLEIRTFAHAASERFINFWYRVFDVALARSLAGSDRNIFIRTFYRGQPLFDIGISEEQAQSSVDPALHQKIITEYHFSRSAPCSYKIYYISDYLNDLTGDINRQLSPYQHLWELKSRRRAALRQLTLIFQKNRPPGAPQSEQKESAVENLPVTPASQSSDTTQSENENNSALELYHYARNAASLLGNRHRLELRIARLAHLNRKYSHEFNSENLKQQLSDINQRINRQLHRLAQLASSADQAATGRSYLGALAELKKIDQAIIDCHLKPDISPAAGSPERENSKDENPLTKLNSERYHGLEELKLDDDVEIGNPFYEHQVLSAARTLIFRRLRPLRRTASIYSIVPEHRHGAMTLNPIMQLWKNRPNISGGDEPELTTLELNTRQTVECLIKLALLVDPELTSRSVQRGRIARLRFGREDLSTLKFFLLPGSCYPIREIHRLDFPEFRERVIGETRNGVELGVAPDEKAVLCGGWYKKENHCLYYPVGGDNGRLLQLIWRSGRSPGPPAFFFALGQFVHDTLEDSLVYYRSGQRTFRECIEEYYRFEDRVMKNRGERMGRRRSDNSRHGIRFMFAVYYSRLMMEALTGSSQSHFRHPPSERWLSEHVKLPLIASADRGHLKELRGAAREIIQQNL